MQRAEAEPRARCVPRPSSFPKPLRPAPPGAYNWGVGVGLLGRCKKGKENVCLE